MLKKLIFLVFLLASCEDEYYYIDSDFESIVENFYYEADLRGYHYSRNVSVVYDHEIKDAGEYHSKTRTVKINYDYIHPKIHLDSNHWQLARLVVFHELGHYVGKVHRPFKYSIMNCGDWFDPNCGDFIGTVQYFNADKSHQKPIIDEFFSK